MPLQNAGDHQQVAMSAEIRYDPLMITLELPQAQRDLAALAEKALGGEDVFIAVGTRTLHLVPTSAPMTEARSDPRPGRGALRGTLTIPDAFYEPWSDEEMGE
jgi:hypothetical protein